MTETNAPKFFKTPFTPAYWKLAAKEFRSLRTLAVASLLIALDVVVARFYIPVGLNLRVYFNYLVTALLSLICGPVVGIAAGFVRDTIGFLLDPSWGYFFGYTVTAMASGLIYGLFLPGEDHGAADRPLQAADQRTGEHRPGMSLEPDDVSEGIPLLFKYKCAEKPAASAGGNFAADVVFTGDAAGFAAGKAHSGAADDKDPVF